VQKSLNAFVLLNLFISVIKPMIAADSIESRYSEVGKQLAIYASLSNHPASWPKAAILIKLGGIFDWVDMPLSIAL
jgi:hypothetical protein